MKRLIAAGAVFVIGAALSGCTYFGSYFEVDQLNKAQPKGSAFTQALTAQYRDRANYSQNVTMNYEQAYRVADRGLITADGTSVQPYAPAEFDVPSAQQQEIAKARAQLEQALTAGARDRAPKEAALAQAKFDCWVEDAEKTWQPELYQVCRKEFYDAFGQMIAMQGEPVDLSSTNINATDLNTNPTYAVDTNADRFLIFFGKSGAKLAPSTVGSLDQIAQIILTREPPLVRVEGHSDRAGTAKSKQKVSEQRAIAVAEALIQRGVPAKVIQTKGLSDSQPLIKTANKKEPANRRVEIWLVFDKPAQ